MKSAHRGHTSLIKACKRRFKTTRIFRYNKQKAGVARYSLTSGGSRAGIRYVFKTILIS
jgi:hypothetical protein